MKKISNVLFGFMLSIFLLLVPVTAQAAGNCVEYNGSNVESQDYSRSASTVNSYLTTASGGRLMLVQAGTGIDGVAAVYYDSSYNFISRTNIPQELPIFGAFYETETNYFLLTGQENSAEAANVEVYRITKYDKSWNRITSVGLYGANTTIPFRAGSARMVHQGKYLLIRTCHQMYKSSDGLNHQANVTIQVDMDSMQITDSCTGVMSSSSGYVSHSFNQFIQLDDNKIVALDHGDAYPRSAVLIKYSTDFTEGTFQPSYWDPCTVVDVVKFPGRTGENATGASLGGFEVSEKYYLAAGNSVVQDDNNLSRSTRNIFVAAVDKDTDEVNMHWITNYEEGDVTTSTPQLVKISAEKYMLLWSREDIVYYTMVNGAGEQTGSTYQVAGNLSDCVPMVYGNKVIWYTWASSTITFYEINLNNPAAVAKQERPSGHDYISNGLVNGYAQLSCSVCGASDQVKVYESFRVYFNSTGVGNYWSSIPTGLQVGDKIWCMYSDLNPSGAEDVIEVVVDNPNVVTGKEGWPNYILTMKGGGTTKVTFRSKYNPSVSYTYTITVEGEPADPSPAPGTISAAGIYCTQTNPSIVAGMVLDKNNVSDDIEYQWIACETSNPETWFEIKPWTTNDEWLDWTPNQFGDYVIVCNARIVGDPSSEVSAQFGTPYHKFVKGICQIPYEGEGGGYLIGFESYDNPNGSYQYEMLILDCTLLAQGLPAWVYTTGKCGVPENCLWTVWQPLYGYYWTLFRLYDGDGNLIDEVCYGFENI